MADKGIDLQDSRITDYPGTGPLPDEAILLVQNPTTRKSHRATAKRVRGAASTGAGSSSAPFADDIVVSLAGGRTFGKFQNGQTIPAKGKTANEVILLAAVESLFPTYATASPSLTQSAPQDGEVGETVANTLTATFSRGDAGALTSIQINKDGARISTAGTASPFSRNSNVVRALGTITYQAFVSYAAGAPKLVTPGNTPDPRTPGVRDPNVPQAAESNLGSNAVVLNGYYRNFYGPANSAPANSADVRNLAGQPLTNGPKQFVLNTGNTQRIFALELAPGQSLVSVIDQDALNKDITAEYVAGNAIQVADASGTATMPYTPRVKVQAAPYDTNHRHLITLG